MGFDDWLSEQDQARRESANSRAADDQIRHANAARVVDALAAELRTVIPRLSAFPAVTVQEHRVDITASITGSTVTVSNWRQSYQAPEGDFATRLTPVGQPRTAWAFKDMWLDEDGHLWFEVGVIADAGLWRRSDLSVQTSGGWQCAGPPARPRCRAVGSGRGEGRSASHRERAGVVSHRLERLDSRQAHHCLDINDASPRVSWRLYMVQELRGPPPR